MKRQMNGLAARMCRSVLVTVVARILTRTSSSFGTGRSTSSMSQHLRRAVPVVDNCLHSFGRHDYYLSTEF